MTQICQFSYYEICELLGDEHVPERYDRMLGALSEQEMELLRTKSVFIAGCGGLGGYLLEYLTRLGVARIRIADGDVFETSNLNRQLLSEPERIGTKKVDAAAARVRRINPDVMIEKVPENLTAENAEALLKSCDLALDALDNAEARHVLSEGCSKAGIPWIHGAIQGWISQAAISTPGDRLIEALYPSDEAAGKASLPFTPALCAAMQASLCTQLLAGREVEYGRVWCFDLLNMVLESYQI